MEKSLAEEHDILKDDPIDETSPLPGGAKEKHQIGKRLSSCLDNSDGVLPKPHFTEGLRRRKLDPSVATEKQAKECAEIHALNETKAACCRAHLEQIAESNCGTQRPLP